MNNGMRPEVNGRDAEDFVATKLSRFGFVEQCDLSPLFAEESIYVKQHVIGPTIYGTDRRVDFLLHGEKLFPFDECDLVVECKWQSSSGSVDEKFPYLVKNIALSQKPTIIILDGGGYRPGAEKWLRAQVDEQEFLEAVVNLGEFEQVMKRIMRH